MEFYVVIIIVAVIEVCILLLLHMWVGKMWLTITIGVVCGLLLLGIGLYDKYHKDATTYKTLSQAEVSSEDNKLYFYFDSAAKATSFCDSQKECEYVIKDNKTYYVATKNHMGSCNKRTGSNIWCALDNQQYAKDSQSSCSTKNGLIDCVGDGCPYKTCDEYYNRIQTCHNCLGSPTKSAMCLTPSSLECKTEKPYTCGTSPTATHISNCNQLMDKYGDVPYYSKGATIYSKSCKGDSALHSYKSCAPTEMIQTSPLFSNDVENTCSHTNECNGYVCENGNCTYLNKQNARCCTETSSPFCLDTMYYCKGKCEGLPTRCVST